MVLSPTQRTRTAFEIAKDLPPEKLAEVSKQNEMDSLEDVAGVLAETYTPSWIFYYLSEEADGTEEVGKYLVSMTPLDKIEEEIDNQLEAEVSINLRTPSSHNWMSDDPMEPFRKEFISHKESLQSNLEDEFTDALESASNVEGVSEDDIESFAESYSERIVDNANYLQINAIQESGDKPYVVILSDMMDISVAMDLAEFIGSEDSREEFISDILEEVTLPKRNTLEHK